MEKRTKEFRFIEMRALDNNSNEMVVEGYAVVFDKTTDLGWIKEKIDRNAFDGADMSDIVMKYNHEDSVLPLARTRGGSLQFEVDSRGLKITATLPDTTSNRDIYTLIKSQVLTKMSFAFTIKEEDYDYETDTRTILKFDKIFDVSVVDFPAYEDTEVYARAEESLNKEKEKYLRAKENFELEKSKLITILNLK